MEVLEILFAIVCWAWSYLILAFRVGLVLVTDKPDKGRENIPSAFAYSQTYKQVVISVAGWIAFFLVLLQIQWITFVLGIVVGVVVALIMIYVGIRWHQNPTHLHAALDAIKKGEKRGRA